MNQLKRLIGFFSSVITLVLISFSPAHAAVSFLPPFILQAKRDVEVAGTLVLGVIVAGTVFFWLRIVINGGSDSAENAFQFRTWDEPNHVQQDISDDVVDPDVVADFFDHDGSSFQDEHEAAVASWEDGFEAQLLRQDAGEYVAHEFVGSQFAADSGVPVDVDASDERHSRHEEYVDWLDSPEGDVVDVETALEVLETEKVARV
ncbi:hypothetical protein [Paraherbaspirillum soli]|uniref:Uncharacterized protein n=1 Tax=Paraherbaspirillum soli TaxID=631222 RepID=A0ABW0MCX6_9BURK